MSERLIATVRLKPTGETVLTPELRPGEGSVFRVVIQGLIGFKYADLVFDAAYQAGPDGTFTERHNLLRWTGATPELESYQAASHRCVFVVDGKSLTPGSSLGIAVNTDALVDRYLITPAEVRQNLSGELRMSITEIVPGLSPVDYALRVGPVGVALGVGEWIMRRRSEFRGLSPELVDRVGEVRRKLKHAREAVKSSSRSGEVAKQLSGISGELLPLVRRLQQIRNRRRSYDPNTLEVEIRVLENQIENVSDPEAARQLHLSIVEKQEVLRSLEELGAAEERCVSRLTRIESLLDRTAVTLSASTIAAAPTADDTLCRELSAEVAAIKEVAEMPLQVGVGR